MSDAATSLPPPDGGARFVLGTAQLGMAYGIANRAGRLDADARDALLDAAWSTGVRILDTAPSYGAAEAAVGAHIRRSPDHGFAVTGKLDGRFNAAPATAVRDAVAASCDALGRPLAGLLLHDDAGLAHWEAGLGRALVACVEDGLVGRIGVSVYDPAAFARALAIDAIGIVQAPFNALDRRLRDGGLLDRAIADGRAVMLRSALLQGLLTLAPADAPSGLGFARDALSAWRAVCERNRLPPAEAAIRYVAGAAPGSHLVIGCESADQVRQCAAWLAAGPLDGAAAADIDALPQGEDRLVNPALWPLGGAPAGR